MVVETLVGAAFVQWATGFDVGARFHVVEQTEEFVFHAFPAAVDGNLEPGMSGADVLCHSKKRRRIIAFSQKQEASDSEVVFNHFIHCRGGKFLSDVIAQKRGVAPWAITPAVGDFNCQGNAVGYFFYDGIRQLRNILKHPAPLECSSGGKPRPGGAPRMKTPS